VRFAVHLILKTGIVIVYKSVVGWLCSSLARARTVAIESKRFFLAVELLATLVTGEERKGSVFLTEPYSFIDRDLGNPDLQVG